MKKTILKLAVIASSVLLAAGFISYRAGAFSWFSPSPANPVDLADNVAESTPVAVEPLPAVMSGTKAPFPSPLPPATALPTQDRPPVIMSGSKSLLIPPPSGKPASQAPAQSQAAKPAQK